jgi:5-methyltetrahydropteroyltriglutamate--homocysteine methyltransferase
LGCSPARPARSKSKGALKRRIREATKLTFASTEEGNTLAEHELWAKLRLVVEIGEEI